MSYILKIVVPSVPPYNHDAYGFADKLLRDSKDVPPAPRLIQFHDALVERFPCASSGAYLMDETAVCPWADNPLMDCFAGDIGIISISARHVEVIPFLLRRAGALALTVIDEQAAKVHRPATFCLTLDSIQKNVDRDAIVAKLVPLLRRDRDDVLQMLATPRAVIRRRMDHVSAQRFAKTLDLIGCNCTVEKELGEQGMTIPISGPGARAVPIPPTYLSQSDPIDDEPDERSPSLLSRLWQRLTRRRVQQW